MNNIIFNIDDVINMKLQNDEKGFERIDGVPWLCSYEQNTYDITFIVIEEKTMNNYIVLQCIRTLSNVKNSPFELNNFYYLFIDNSDSTPNKSFVMGVGHPYRFYILEYNIESRYVLK